MIAKDEFIKGLREYKKRITALKREITKLSTDQVSRKAIREEADEIASFWVEEIRSPLEHRFKIEPKTVLEVSEQMKQLHVLSRPNNQKSSYTRCLNAILKKFDDKFILPLQQDSPDERKTDDFRQYFSEVSDPELTDYLKEAIECAENGHFRAAIVMGWCAAIDVMQKKVLNLGFSAFNAGSTKVKKQTSGKFKRWNKEFNISTLSELQTVFDTDLIIVFEGIEILDGNQAQRLESCFQYRNHSAHPGNAPIEKAHVVSFFTDISKIVLTNKEISIT